VSGGEPADETTVATLNYSWTYRDVDSMLAPTRGYIVNLQGGGGGPVDGSGNSGFLRFYAKGAGFIPVGRADSVILRGEFGRVFASSRQGIPEAFLFRAGGDQSVRGYAFQELGVAEGDAIVGGRYLYTLSAEYVHQIVRDWGIAAFVDAGNAADSHSDLDPNYGYGLGARWRSPVGMVALDVAYGEAKDQFRVHLSLGFTF
jgi:translocation and assembly module TamA